METTPTSEEPMLTDEEIKELSGKDLDIDLTKLSSTMVYSEVYNMVTNPDKYRGKKVRMQGNYTYYHDENTLKDYFSCMIQDAAACCSQGIEFCLTKKYKFPDDYPQENEEICVEGILDTYVEGGNWYLTLRKATLV